MQNYKALSLRVFVRLVYQEDGSYQRNDEENKLHTGGVAS